MSKTTDSSGEIAAPDDSLNAYFNDLLGADIDTGDLLEHAFTAMESQPVTAAVASVGARIVSLPAKKRSTNKLKNLELRPEPASKTSSKPRLTFADSEPIQTLEQKLKLERLLQSARPQLLTETKTRFVPNPEEIQDWVIETPASEQLVMEADVAEEQHLVETVPHASQFQIEGLEWLENGRPQWAQSRFDVLLFKVSGLTLAVPLISLGQIQPLTEELTPLFGQADWFMGLQPTPAGKIRTVNTAKFVMPERYDEAFLQTAKYVVSINGVPWGLAVDSVNQPIVLQPEDVKWRGDRSKRPWLAGTVKEHMCALLDIPRIGQMLIEADKNFVAAQ